MATVLTIDWNEFIKEMYPEQPKPEEIKQAAKWKLSQITKSQGSVAGGGQSAGFGSIYGNQLPTHGWVYKGSYPVQDATVFIDECKSYQPAVDPSPDKTRFPHTCPACSKPAYIGFTTVECSSSSLACRHGI